MSDRFIKFIPSEEAMFLLKNKGHAFRLLTIIAESVRRYDGGPDGLHIGEAFIGGHKKYDMTERNYRTAKEILIIRRHIKIVETSRTRKKSTNGTTTEGTKVMLLSSNVWDVNIEDGNERGDECPTNDRRMTDDKLRSIKKEKKEKKENTPSPFSSEKISFRENVKLTQKEFDSLLAKHGKEFLDRMLDALDAYKGSSGKEYKSDFHTMKEGGWMLNKIKDELLKSNKSLTTDTQVNEVFAQKLEQKYSSYKNSWRCRIYNDSKKDQKGLLFECESPYVPTNFVAFSNARFKDEIYKLLKMNNME
jgi:hypothetical protein